MKSKNLIFSHLFLRFYANKLVKLAYLGVLNRDADEVGLAAYTKSLARSRDLQHILSELVGSQEHWEKSLDTRAHDLVTSIFQVLLGRSPEPVALERYATMLAETHDLVPIMSAIASSDEHWEKSLDTRAHALVTSIFQALLGRSPEPAALEQYVTMLAETHDLAPLMSLIASSDEHWEKSVDTRAHDLVTSIFQALLGRSPEPAALEQYAIKLTETHDLAPIMSAIVSSDEHWEKSLEARAPELVSTIFQALLSRSPEPAALEQYATMLTETHDLAQLLSEIVSSDERWDKSIQARAPELVVAVSQALLGRVPEPVALARYVELLTESHDLTQLLLVISESREHWQKLVAQNAALIVHSAFEALLKRSPYPHEVASHSASLEKSKNITHLLQEISNDAEHWEKMLSSNAEALVECIYLGILKRLPEASETAVHAPELVSLKSITSLLDVLMQGVVASEVDKATQALAAMAPPVQIACATEVVEQLEFTDGFYKKESAGFAWSRSQSSIDVNGCIAIYLSCNYLAPLQQRKILVTDEEKQYEVVLEDSFSCHKILINTHKSKTIVFKADGSFSPNNEGLSNDARDLAFQLWTQRPDVHYIRRPVPRQSYLIFVADAKKEIDSLNAVYRSVTSHNVRTKLMDTASAINLVGTEDTANHCFVISGSATYAALSNAGAQGKFIYMEHGVSPLKKYTYSAHYRKYDLALLPGDLWTNRLVKLYPEMVGRCKAVGYAKLQAAIKLNTEQRTSMCAKLQLDPAKPIILFAPSWSGGDRDCGIHNLRFFDKSTNLFTVPHDGDMPFAKQFTDAGYSVCRPGEHESISDYYHLADILVSDISSTAIEFAALGKPVICISMPRIPDFENKFREGEHKLKIPHTDHYWDFCDWSLRQDINMAIEKIIAEPLTSKELKMRQNKVKQIVVHVGQKATECSTKAIIEFLNQPMFNLTAK